MDDEERQEVQRKRHRALLTQVRRALITAADGIKQWLDDDPEQVASYDDRVTAGDSRTLPKPTNRPPAPFNGIQPDESASFREHDRLMRKVPDPNGRLDRR